MAKFKFQKSKTTGGTCCSKFLGFCPGHKYPLKWVFWAVLFFNRRVLARIGALFLYATTCCGWIKFFLVNLCFCGSEKCHKWIFLCSRLYKGYLSALFYSKSGSLSRELWSDGGEEGGRQMAPVRLVPRYFTRYFG